MMNFVGLDLTQSRSGNNNTYDDQFTERRSKIVKGDQRNHPFLVATKSTQQQVEEFIKDNRRVTKNCVCDSIATAIGCSHGSACSIMHASLNLRKVCSRWIPRQLTKEHKK
ncbi:hypothetical protein TNCV_415961 [Trichonephila clavipes]|nr:hypothetical protein TNCV_415961 [Trichonephila clavipes]